MSEDTALHVKLCREKADAAREELGKDREAVVGDLSVKAVEQAIEAAASLEGLHFHAEPRRAHSARMRWAKSRYDGIANDLDELWGAYGALGYEGLDGDRARKAVAAMERVIRRIARESNLSLT